MAWTERSGVEGRRSKVKAEFVLTNLSGKSFSEEKMRDGLDGTEWSQRSKVEGRRSKVGNMNRWCDCLGWHMDFGLSDFPTFRLSDFPTFRLSDFQTFRLLASARKVREPLAFLGHAYVSPELLSPTRPSRAYGCRAA